jgi:hypothetical protein
MLINQATLSKASTSRLALRRPARFSLTSCRSLLRWLATMAACATFCDDPDRTLPGVERARQPAHGTFGCARIGVAPLHQQLEREHRSPARALTQTRRSPTRQVRAAPAGRAARRGARRAGRWSAAGRPSPRRARWSRRSAACARAAPRRSSPRAPDDTRPSSRRCRRRRSRHGRGRNGDHGSGLRVTTDARRRIDRKCPRWR